MLWIAKAIESQPMTPMRLQSVQLGERFRAEAEAEGLKVSAKLAAKGSKPSNEERLVLAFGLQVPGKSKNLLVDI